MCKNNLLPFPIVGIDFCIQSAMSQGYNDIAGAPAKYLNKSTCDYNKSFFSKKSLTWTYHTHKKKLYLPSS